MIPNSYPEANAMRRYGFLNYKLFVVFCLRFASEFKNKKIVHQGFQLQLNQYHWKGNLINFIEMYFKQYIKKIDENLYLKKTWRQNS